MLDLFKNIPLLAAVLGFLASQFIKVIIYKDIKAFGRYGGMPSAHISTLSALAWTIAQTTGYDSPQTAIAAIFLAVTASDAVGLRRKVDPNTGHTMAEAVAGFILGMIIAFLIT
ncbi:MAG: divergent PAP2 family protein [Thermosipho sp. (in: Bacteria)]|nr:divergent PAP2 family protein [Thermosipho sp. (in: thermotogales)]